ncbi:MAG TPA: hypothetical protein DCX03_02190 [Bacteroidales bacterium]|nr:hypothetical protein [Bacteroidales bacterium]
MPLQIEVIGYIATALSLFGNVLVVLKKRSGFVVWTVANCTWLVVDVKINLYSQIWMMAVYAALNLWGLIMWRKD